MQPPKINPEIECAQQFKSNTIFLMTNEKSLNSSQNYVVKTISILSNIANSVLWAWDSNSLEALLDHVNILKVCKIAVTLLGHISTEFRRRRKNNLQNNSEIFCNLCAGPAASKLRPKNFRSVFLLGDNLK